MPAISGAPVDERKFISERFSALEKFRVAQTSGSGSASGSGTNLLSLQSLSLAQRLFAAILRKDRNETRELIWQQFKDDRAEFLSLIRQTRFAGLAVDNLCEMGLMSDPPEDLRFALIDLFEEESVESRHSDTGFGSILLALSPYAIPPVWIKAAALAHVIYPESYYRECGELDVVIHPSYLSRLYRDLEKIGYSRVYSAGVCNQYGVGPVESVDDLLLAPSDGWVPSSALTLQKFDSPTIRVRVNPYEQGIVCSDLENFFEQPPKHYLKQGAFFAPNDSDHLLICLHHLYTDRFLSWSTLFDVHLLATKLNETSGAWSNFVERCKCDSMTAIAWAGLTLTCDRFGTAVPADVLEQFKPPDGKLNHLLRFAVSPHFVWNATSLPMMIVNALLSEDRAKKLRLLSKSLMPTKLFLSHYYGKHLSNQSHALLLHWLVLFLPGTVVRSWFGMKVWPSMSARMQNRQVQNIEVAAGTRVATTIS